LRGVLNLEEKNIDQAFMDLKKIMSSAEWDGNKYSGQQSEEDHRLDLFYATNYMSARGSGLSDEAYLNLKEGYCYLVVNSYQKAKISFNKSLKIEKSAIAWFFKGIAYEHTEKHDSAYYCYGESLLLDEENFDALKKRAIYNYALNDYKKTFADMDKMIALHPEKMVTYKLRGIMRIKWKDYAGAIMDLTKCLNADSSDLELLVNRGFCQQKLNSPEAAYADYRLALQKGFNERELYDTCLEGYIVLKDTLNLLETLTEYRTRFREIAYPCVVSVRYFKLLDMPDSVRKYALEAKGKLYYIRTDRIRIERDIAILDYQDKHYAQALETMNSSISENPNDLELRYYRAKTYYEMGDYAKAKKDFSFLKEAGYLDSKDYYDRLVKK
jgi:tetratricopeptide (TPR) repeat protein